MPTFRKRFRMVCGKRAKLPVLDVGEPALVLDTPLKPAIFIGSPTGNLEQANTNGAQIVENKITVNNLWDVSLSSNSFIITTPHIFNNYIMGMTVYFMAPGTNAANPTISINSKPAVPLISREGLPLSGNEIMSGGIYAVIFDGLAFRLL